MLKKLSISERFYFEERRRFLKLPEIVIRKMKFALILSFSGAKHPEALS